MNKILKLSSALLLLFTVSCVKEFDKTFTDLSQVNDMVILQNSGISAFSSAAIVIGPSTPDTLELEIFAGLASINSSNTDIKVTLAVDDAQRTTYNASNGTSYLVFPAGSYKLVNTNVTIPAGGHYVSTMVEIYKAKIPDLTKSYMLPITITDASGKTLSTNQNTIFFHIIGNPLAGPYNVAGTRYNYTGSIGYAGGPIPPGYGSTATSPSPKFAAPVSPTVITLDYANLGPNGYQYVVTYTAPSTITVVANATLAAAVSNFTVFVQTYDPATKTIHILSSYNNGANGSGSDRIIDETFVHQ